MDIELKRSWFVTIIEDGQLMLMTGNILSIRYSAYHSVLISWTLLETYFRFDNFVVSIVITNMSKIKHHF